MTKKSRWNIWRVKNRWLRAVCTLFVMLPFLVFMVVLFAVLSVVVGMIEGGRSAWWAFTKHQDADIYRNFWRALTLREAA